MEIRNVPQCSISKVSSQTRNCGATCESHRKGPRARLRLPKRRKRISAEPLTENEGHLEKYLSDAYRTKKANTKYMLYVRVFLSGRFPAHAQPNITRYALSKALT